MSDYVSILKSGAGNWNNWRNENPSLTIDFSGEDLRGINLYFRANLEGVNFSRANLTNARLEGANLRHANMSFANLEGANLRKATCRGCNFYSASLKKTTLVRTFLDEADLRFVDFSDAFFEVNSIVDATVEGAFIKDMIFSTDSPSEWGTYEKTNLAYVKDLDKVDYDSQATVIDYLAFINEEVQGWEAVIKRGDYHKGLQNYIETLLSKVSALQNLYFPNSQVDKSLITAISTINKELLQMIQRDPKLIHHIHWRVFEELIAEILASQGWKIELTNPTKDNGYDILGIYKDSLGIKSSWIIECKKWSPQNKVGVEIARSLYAVKNDLRVGGAMLATTSTFTRGVEQFKTSRYDFETKDFSEIVEWLNLYRPAASGKLYLKDNRISSKK